MNKIIKEIQANKLPFAIFISVILGASSLGAAGFYFVNKKKKYKYKRPLKILLIRHGQSMGNVNSEAYTTIGDHNIKLSPLGEKQAHELGLRLQKIVGDKKVLVYSSPYERALKTAEISLSYINPKQILRFREDVRLREQEFEADYQKPGIEEQKLLRKQYSSFFYRFRNGESSGDVYSRVSSFLESIWRDFARHKIQNGIVIVYSHGLTSRLFLTRWLHLNYRIFEKTSNPGNCDILELVRGKANKDGVVYYYLTEETLKILNITEEQAYASRNSEGKHPSSSRL